MQNFHKWPRRKLKTVLYEVFLWYFLMNLPTIFVMDFTVMSAWALDRPPNGLELDTPGIESYSSIPGTANNKQKQ